MRGALFNILGDVSGLTFLDAFAGTGALSFEAVSRGAKSVTAIEKDRAAFIAIKRSVEELDIGVQVHVVRSSIGGWSLHNPGKFFDIVLLDPPYDEIQPKILQKTMNHHVKKSGLAVLSCPGKAMAPKFEGYRLVEQKNYGDAQLAFYRKSGK